MNKKKERSGFRIDLETVILVVIACCMVFLNTFTVKKLNELELAGQSAMFVMDDVDFQNGEELKEEIKDYLPDSYKMIELYDEDLELMIQIQFSEEGVQKDDIRNHKELVDIIKSNEEGQTTVTIGDSEQDIYFRWIKNNRGETRLMIVYSSMREVNGIWIFSFVSYTVIVLVFILVIRLHGREYKEKIHQYKVLASSMRDPK